MRCRFLPATVAAVLLLGGVTSCAAQSDAAPADCQSSLHPGPMSDNVEVLGSYGTVPEVVVNPAFQASYSQVTVLQQAQDRSRRAVEDTLVSANVTFFDANTNERIYQSQAFTKNVPSEFFIVSEQFSNPLGESVKCFAPGDRLVLALSPTESMQVQQQFGGTPGASVVAVIDLVDTRPLAAKGKNSALPSGYPAVVTNEHGQPGVVLPPREAPQGVSSANRIVGDGPVVAEDNNVVAHFLSVPWDGNTTQVENSWKSGINGVSALGTEREPQQSYRAQLTGKTVGSQVVIIENVDGEARVIVVDILGVI